MAKFVIDFRNRVNEFKKKQKSHSKWVEIDVYNYVVWYNRKSKGGFEENDGQTGGDR